MSYRIISQKEANLKCRPKLKVNEEEHFKGMPKCFHLTWKGEESNHGGGGTEGGRDLDMRREEEGKREHDQALRCRK